MNVHVSGHASRNIRLSLAAIDLVQPYVCIDAVNAKNREISLQWYVGGAIHVDMSFFTIVPALTSTEDLHRYMGNRAILFDLLGKFLFFNFCDEVRDWHTDYFILKVIIHLRLLLFKRGPTLDGLMNPI